LRGVLEAGSEMAMRQRRPLGVRAEQRGTSILACVRTAGSWVMRASFR
jgi:hypothetical protein